MPPEDLEKSGGGVGARRAVRLVPPPRIAVPPASRQKLPGERRGFGLLLIPPLAALLVFVFVYLPGWVAAPAATTTSPPMAATTLPATQNVPSGVDSQAVGEPLATLPPATQVRQPAPTPAPPPPPPATRAPLAAPKSPPGQTAREEFVRAMSQGLAALDAGDSAEAVEALRLATGLDPSNRAATEALRRAVLASERAAIDTHVARGRELAAQELWAASLAEYEVALKLDPTIAAAQAGAAQAAPRARLDAQLEFHISRPARLSDEAVGREAELLLDAARDLDGAGPRLEGQIASLASLLERARQPVSVRLRSDGATQVVVHRVGRLGAFEEKSLELRPGTYTVVGTRHGYRDVRQTLVVSPGGAGTEIVVRCEEAI